MTAILLGALPSGPSDAAPGGREAGVGPFSRAPWSASADAPGYADATVHEPHFDDRRLWPVSAKAKFLAETWPTARLLVWAHPGESGGDRDPRAKHQVFDLDNWIEAATGKPPTKLLDEKTDVLLPASDTPYMVHYRKRGEEHFPFTIRHLTVESGAYWRTSGVGVLGNVWIKRGGRVANHGSLKFLGPKDTFCRNDNGDPSTPQRGDAEGIGQYITFTKPGASCEFLGAFATSDEFRVLEGTFIIGRDSRVQPGRNATPMISHGATLVLLDGAAFGKWCNQIYFIDLHVHGTVQGGTPERPLTRDAHLGVSYQNTNGTDFYPDGIDTWPEKKKMNEPIVPLLFHEGSRIKTCSRDPARACLVIGWTGIEAADYYTSKLLFRRMSEAGQTYLVRQLDSLPKYVMAAFARGVEVDGVRFNRFLEGGILLEDPAVRASWKNVFYGDENQAPPQKLYREADIDFSRGTYGF